MWQGKKKILTFSYDDAVTQDQRLIAMLDKYGLKCTFNINADLLGKAGSLVREGVTVAHVKPRAEEIRAIYEGHEIAGHSLTHPNLCKLDDAEVVRQVEEDRLKLSELAGYEVVGFAYPGGYADGRVASLIRRETGIKYARTVVSSHSFDRQEDLILFKPTVYHHCEWDKLFELGDRFLSLDPEDEAVFYVWGHAYEFDIGNTWDRFEEFCRMMSGKNDIYYGTNREAFGV